MGKKLTYEFIKNEFKIKGYELLEGNLLKLNKFK